MARAETCSRACICLHSDAGKGNWHPVKIKSKNADGTYVAYVQDDGNTWDVVVPFWIRTRSELTEEAKVALEKVFKRYSEGSA